MGGAAAFVVLVLAATVHWTLADHSVGDFDPPAAAGGECAASCVSGHGCPLTVPGVRCDYIVSLVEGNLVDLLANSTSGDGHAGRGSRSVPSAALAQLLTQCPQGPGCCAPGIAACVQPPPPPVCAAAMQQLRNFGGPPGTSFGGQAYPLIWHTFAEGCFHGADRAFLLQQINASLPMTIGQATPQEYSYTNMWLMSTVNAILFGEIVGGERGRISAAVGYQMFDEWFNYTLQAGIHEFTSPTYTYVQLTALYPAYIFAAKPGARAKIGQALDMIWADTAANTFPPRGALSGPHSRDYDTLLGHGMLLIEMYLWGLPGVEHMHCEQNDPHCEGPVAAADPRWETANGASTVGTGEPMTVVSISLYNLLHPKGYRPPQALRQLPSAAAHATRVVRSRFIAQNVTANGLEARFGDLYNFITPTFAMGSASQAYITNTHSKYYPNVEDKLVNILLGNVSQTPPYTPSRLAGDQSNATRRESPAITLQGDWKDMPYGAGPSIHNYNVNSSHIALHIGAAQEREALLLTSALNTADKLQFTTAPGGDMYKSLATNLLLPADAEEYLVMSPTGAVREIKCFLSLPISLYLSGTCLGKTSLFRGRLINHPFVYNRADFLQVVAAPVITPRPKAWKVSVGDSLCLRIGGGGLGVKVFELDGVAGQSPSLQLVADSTGLGLNAVRLVGQHFRSATPQWLNGSKNGLHARFAAVAIASAASSHAELETLCARVARTSIRSTVDGAGIWTAEANASVLVDAANSSSDGGDGGGGSRMVSLSVGRDLGCSAGGVRNQTVSQAPLSV
jgi:hypothetical protein